MRLRNWLLTGTGIGLFALAPLSVQAQDADLVAAYQSYVAAQASGDAAAVEAARATLTELCIVAGYPNLDACIAAVSGGGQPPAPPPPPEPEPEPEPAPPPAPEPEPAPPPEPEPAPPPPPAPEPEPEPAPPPPPEPEPAPPAPEPEPAPAPEPEPVPAPPPAPDEIEQPPAEEPPPPPPEAPPPAPEVLQQPDQPAQPPADAPAPGAPGELDLTDALNAELDVYNAALSDMLAGGDPAAARAQMEAAIARMRDYCAEAGYPSLEECLADYGITLPAMPPAPPAGEPVPAEPEPEPDPAPEPGAEPEPAPDAVPAPDEQPIEIIEDLPEGVTEEDIAPVLDSAKDAETEQLAPEEAPAVPGEEPLAEPEPQPEPVPAVEPGPPPTSDAEAQAAIAIEEGAVVSAVAEEGETVEVDAIEPVSVPQNVTIINQTNVTNINNITNITNTNVNFGNVLTQVIVQMGNQLIINNRGQDTERFIEAGGDEVYYERLGDGRIRETVLRPDGTRIVTVRNRNGDILQRSRFTPDGQEYILAWFDDRYYDDLLEWRDPGASLPPLRLTIPVTEYVLDARYADQQQIGAFFSQPPVEQVTRLYSIDEVKRSARVRDMVRRLEVGNLTFDTGSASISSDQVGALSAVASAMLDLLAVNPAETFLIEGHTDAPGSDLFNLRLSDQRAATVARILTDFYGIPPENLVTQGYGERYLKIRTELAERENRRVTIRRITPLVTPYVAAAG